MTLAVLSLAQFLIALDYSIIYVALPSIGRDLGLSPAVGQWVISAYAVLFAGFLMVGGRLADRYGPRRLFVVAVTAFGLFSAVGGVATDGTVLLAARGAQGLAAALLQPAVLALLGISFAAGPARNRALAAWGSVGASGLAAGAILGGLLTTASWRWTFVINVPLTLLALAGGRRHLPRSRPAAGRAPLVASVLGTAAVLSLVIGLTVRQAPFFIASAVLFAGFLGNEMVSCDVLIPRALRRIPSLHAGAVAAALYMASVGSEFYLVTLLLQTERGYGPLRAGLAFLPLAVLVTLGSAAAGRAVRRLTPAAVLTGGFLLAAAGLGWLVVTLHGSGYAVSLLPGLLLSGFGHGVIYTSMFIIGTRDVPAEHQGAAGSLLTTSQYLSGAVTVAVLTLVLDSAGFRWAFAITAGAAVAGAVAALAGSVRRAPSNSAHRGGGGHRPAGKCRTDAAACRAWQLTPLCGSSSGTIAVPSWNAARMFRR
jgi:MFS family permease